MDEPKIEVRPTTMGKWHNKWNKINETKDKLEEDWSGATFSNVDEQWWNAKSERMDAPSKIGTMDELKKVGQWMNLGQLEMRN
jgi:hypothetical protein